MRLRMRWENYDGAQRMIGWPIFLSKSLPGAVARIEERLQVLEDALTAENPQYKLRKIKLIEGRIAALEARTTAEAKAPVQRKAKVKGEPKMAAANDTSIGNEPRRRE